MPTRTRRLARLNAAYLARLDAHRRAAVAYAEWRAMWARILTAAADERAAAEARRVRDGAPAAVASRLAQWRAARDRYGAVAAARQRRARVAPATAARRTAATARRQAAIGARLDGAAAVARSAP